MWTNEQQYASSLKLKASQSKPNESSHTQHHETNVHYALGKNHLIIELGTPQSWPQVVGSNCLVHL
jgi:hypothetical protein